MRRFKLPTIDVKATREKLRGKVSSLSRDGLEQLFNKIDQLGVKKGVDQLGLEKFINQCAIFAAGSGVLSGIGGVGVMAIGIPLDTINILAQQFRVTLAITYTQTGNYELRFDDFFKLLARSIKGDASVVVTKTAMEEVAQKIMLNVGAKTSKRLVPVVGGIIGGSANYFYIKRVAEALKKN
ncbi:hypothetical protein RYH73_14215 [Olivibacter sp. CPCC 100613]|uniref:hypothetical protein n=1 Tax=Olivibacter sp. CPCC 100613 TaxID=3079931 RepID=UPI002FF4A2C8